MAETLTTKVTPKTLKLARKLSSLTGRKLYDVIELAVAASYEQVKANGK